jgi:L-alanine-DL-glutamate epimerase-like enolase superfamily enzyme
LRDRIWPAVRGRDVSDATAADVPCAASDGRCMNAAACAVDVAIAWACGPAGPRRRITSRVSGVLGSADPAKTARRLRLMRLYGLRDFKLKLGFGEDVDAENLRIVHRKLGRGIRRGRASLRVDVNGGWDVETTPDRVERLKAFGVCVVEQPVFASAGELVELAGRCSLPLMADESLITESDAQTLLDDPRRVWWNVRISKNGGLSRAARLLELAAAHGVTVSNGCMVGESGILSAAQRRLLEAGPQPRFVEGNYGRLLLSDDLTRPSIRFGYGGRLKALRGVGFGVDVDPAKLDRYATLIASLS